MYQGILLHDDSNWTSRDSSSTYWNHDYSFSSLSFHCINNPEISIAKTEAWGLSLVASYVFVLTSEQFLLSCLLFSYSSKFTPCWYDFLLIFCPASHILEKYVAPLFPLANLNFHFTSLIDFNCFWWYLSSFDKAPYEGY